MNKVFKTVKILMFIALTAVLCVAVCILPSKIVENGWYNIFKGR